MPNLNIPLTVTGTDFITVLPDGTEFCEVSGALNFLLEVLPPDNQGLEGSAYNRTR